jgi:hypothetical protein
MTDSTESITVVHGGEEVEFYQRAFYRQWPFDITMAELDKLVFIFNWELSRDDYRAFQRFVVENYNDLAGVNNAEVGGRYNILGFSLSAGRTEVVVLLRTHSAWKDTAQRLDLVFLLNDLDGFHLVVPPEARDTKGTSPWTSQGQTPLAEVFGTKLGVSTPGETQ